MNPRKSASKAPTYSTRFKASQMMLVEAAAEKLGLPRSTFLRKAALVYARKVVKDKPVKELVVVDQN